MKKCGFITILGQPNAGKSTLINHLVGAKISIVSRKVQTTRRRILGLVVKDDTQMIFMDTPGIFDPKKPLEKAMVAAAWEAPSSADITIVIIDAAYKNLSGSESILTKLSQNSKSRIVLCLNKTDTVEKEELLKLAEHFKGAFPIEEIFMISALKGHGMDDLLSYCQQNLPNGPWLYPEDQITDLPQRLFAAEITREHLFHRVHQELPYALTVETESWEPFRDGSIKISQIIYVESDNHKSIILGNKGEKIKAIGAAARRELTDILETKIHLMLFVKVDPKWTLKRERFEEMGLELVSPAPEPSTDE